jgi:hypothetical protein
MPDPEDTSQPDRGKAGRSTSQETDSGMVFTTHQRADLRWFYRIDGKESERTYPTAGEAERGALMALNEQRKNRPDHWKTWIIVAVAVAPILYCVWSLARMLMDR